MSDIPLLARELVRLGASCIFGIPGEGSSLLLLDELEKCGCTFHLVPHESAGALAAGGFGRVAGVPGVSLSIKGPGFSNMLPGIASNWLDRNPALSLAESYGPGASSHRLHKRLDHAGLVRPVAKAYADNISSQLLPELWDLCLSEEPGPVHVDISHRMEGGSISQKSGKPFQNIVRSAAIRRIRAASHPVVIAGALATRRSWRSALAELNIPVFTTFAGKGALDESLPHSAGIFTNSGGEYTPEKTILGKADLIIGLALRTSEILDVMPLPAPLIVLDELDGTAKGLEAAEEWTAVAEDFLEVLQYLANKEWDASEVLAAKQLLENKLELDRWLPAGVFRASQNILSDQTLFFLDTGSFCTIGEHALTARRPLQVMGSALARSMGVGIPAAVGAALAAPDKPVVIATGDGGIRMYPECITIALREKLPLLVLLMADGFLSSVRQSAFRQGLGENRLRVDSSCWIAIFKAWGCDGERIESHAALEKALAIWKKSPGPLLLELAFDPDEYMAMTTGIR